MNIVTAQLGIAHGALTGADRLIYQRINQVVKLLPTKRRADIRKGQLNLVYTRKLLFCLPR